ncbi:tetratricopeptide repeat protein 4-like [Sinocyclocheilus rhinocerous]|uniref:Tetratricopeptide repeat protein 4-like n=1 Tax=Sinocyclocheilus rhinocerous TaxID=307959 RepID=A0A673JQ32_9TELE|nr:PREDICTED: tetratricopeptide repeat protein 4-like [Sinocyclocheilus rhinocerous]
MAALAQGEDSDDNMDEFMEKFKTQKYKNAFSESNWEEEFDKVPMFMKTAPENIDPEKHPDLACIQSIIHDDHRTPEEKARSLKDEGNEYFKEKNYKKAIVSYTEGLKKNCMDIELNAIFYTNRAAAHFHLGNMRSALNDATAAKKLKPDHIKAIIRGAQCSMELCNYAGASQWCDEGLRLIPTDKKLQELRATADKQKREADRDARKVKIKAKKEQNEKEALLAAIKERGIKLLKTEPSRHRGSDSEDGDGDGGASRALADLELDGISSQEATGARVYMDEQGVLYWPVLFLYPEHSQTDFISAFCENSSFMDHLAVMFGEELPPWDSERKYQPQNLQLFFEDPEKGNLYQVDLEKSLLNVLQHQRCSVKAGTPSFIVLVSGSSFSKQFLSGKKVQRLK